MHSVMEESQKYVMNTYGRFPLVLEKGEGCYLFDIKGKKYLDMCAGIAVNALGYCHPKINQAISNQMNHFFHVSNLYYTKPQVEVAKLLVENGPFAKAFFCNSGAEANEAALKLARKYGKSKNENKTKIISMYQSFHGRTYGAVSATGQTKYQKNFLPTLGGIEFATYNDIQSVKALINEETCAVILEVIQGEGGIRPAEPAFLQEVQNLCKKYDALLIVDEVQTGMGRTGSLFAFEQFGIEPDVVTLAKGLGGGAPIGSMLCNERADVLVPGDHASTFGGNPLVTAAAEVVLRELLESNLLEHVQEMGEYLSEKLQALKEKSPIIVEVRGKGLMQGIELEIPAKDVIAKCIESGLILVGAGEKVIRFVPPLIITKEQITEGIQILEQVLQA